MVQNNNNNNNNNKTWDVDVNTIFVSTLIETKNCSKCLIGYLLSKVSGYVKTFEEKDSLK